MSALPSKDPVVSQDLRPSQPWAHWFSFLQSSVTAQRQSGTTAQRPVSGLWIGRQYFDTSLGLPVYVRSVGPVVWVTAAGVVA